MAAVYSGGRGKGFSAHLPRRALGSIPESLEVCQGRLADGPGTAVSEAVLLRLPRPAGVTRCGTLGSTGR
jgi:hypothetical protein